MAKSPDNRTVCDSIKKELEAASIPAPAAVRDQLQPNADEKAARPISEPFLDAILEVIAKSIEQALADVITRCVGEAVWRSLRPLAQEIALLRTAIEHSWRNSSDR